MKKSLGFLIAVFLVLTAAFCLTACTPKPKLMDMNGNVIKFSDYHGKWVVINYWATWCKPCRKEIPELNAFYLAHKDKDAAVFGYNFDKVPVNMLPQVISQMDIKFPVILTDPSTELGVDNVPGVPVTFLINPEGKLVRVLLGEQTKTSLEFAMGLGKYN